METILHPVDPSLTAGAAARDYRGTAMAPFFTNAAEEFRAAISSCAVVDESWRVRTRVAGGDASRWLNGMITNTAALDDGSGNYSFLLSAQSRLQGDAYVYRRGEAYVLETSRDQQEKVLHWLDHYIIMDDVTLTPDDALASTIAVVGPGASSLLNSFGVSTAGLPALKLSRASMDGVAVEIVLDDTSCVPMFHLWHDRSQSERLWRAIVRAGGVEAGAETQEFLRIASGTPLFGVDLQERDLPQETGQNRALHFAKGCYIGQEIVERIHSRGNVHRGWRGFALSEGAEVSAGATIVAEDKVIGTLTSVASLPLAEKPMRVGLGIVRLKALEEHARLTADGVNLQAAALPFVMNPS